MLVENGHDEEVAKARLPMIGMFGTCHVHVP